VLRKGQGFIKAYVAAALRHCFEVNEEHDKVTVEIYGVYPPRGDAKLAIEDVPTMFSRRVGAVRFFTASGVVAAKDTQQLRDSALLDALSIMESMSVGVLQVPAHGGRGGQAAAAAADDSTATVGGVHAGFTPLDLVVAADADADDEDDGGVEEMKHGLK
jgi:hypothetical protein